MSIGVVDLFEAVESHVLQSGWFERVNRHEPKSAPGNGLWAAVWVQQIGPARGGSGLNSTSGRLELRIRCGSSALQEPADEIDTNILLAVDDLLGRYSADFELGDRVRMVDLLGAYGDPLGARAGYVNISGKYFRIMDIVLPLIINDIWQQVN